MYEDNKKVLIKQAEELHDLTTTTCELCGGEYEENLNTATSYFMLNGKRFKMTIERA